MQLHAHQRIERAIEKHRRLLKYRRMRAKRWLKPFPRRANIHRYPGIKLFSNFAKKNSFFWSYKPAPLRTAFYLGSVVTMLPLLGLQILVGFFLAWVFRANLTVTVALQFLSNIFTAAPIYFLTYNVGMLPLKYISLPESTFTTAFYAVMIGGVVCGLILGLLLDLLYRFTHWKTKRLKQQVIYLTALTDKSSST